jgi:hypothetical protein
MKLWLFLQALLSDECTVAALLRSDNNAMNFRVFRMVVLAPLLFFPPNSIGAKLGFWGVRKASEGACLKTEFLVSQKEKKRVLQTN